ncbi:hypothetical protein KSP39_PZI004175 [Platanthera zijinensis]|uniref:PSP proline-rich domain-containing protein n=1 Tax=Platanthera zijinensis TaxID=2320716 RepID=A0AAP0BXQ9_9ASPA
MGSAFSSPTPLHPAIHQSPSPPTPREVSSTSPPSLLCRQLDHSRTQPPTTIELILHPQSISNQPQLSEKTGFLISSSHERHEVLPNNILYPKEDRERKILLYACCNCDHQRYGPPPSYPQLKIPGLNAPIPPGASFGYHPGGWGKPPVDEVSLKRALLIFFSVFHFAPWLVFGDPSMFNGDMVKRTKKTINVLSVAAAAIGNCEVEISEYLTHLTDKVRKVQADLPPAMRCWACF